MALIPVEEVVEAKMGPYLDSIKDPEKRKEVVQEYVDAAKESIESAVKEAESLIESINTSLKGVTMAVPTIIIQVASLAGMIDPVAKAAQLTTIKQSVDTLKDNLSRASSQLQQVMSIGTQIGVPIPGASALTGAISAASSLISTIPL